MRYIFLIFFGIHLLSSVALASDLNSFNTQIAKDIQLTEIDSTEIYQNLITEENLDANYTPNVVGIVIGSFFTGIGTLWLFNGLQCYFDKYLYLKDCSFDNEEERQERKKDVFDNVFEYIFEHTTDTV